MVWARRETRWLMIIVSIGAVLRLGMALYLGNEVTPTPAAFDQIFFHDVALNLLAGKGYVYNVPPWPFIQPGEVTAFGSFVYPLFLAGVYWVFGPHALAARIVQALICCLMPWQVHRLVHRIALQPPRWEKRAGLVALVAAAITAGYAYFVYYGATLMTEGLYLIMVVWALNATLALAEAPTRGRWAAWGLSVALASLLRQVFMPMSALLFLYVVWRRGWRVRLMDVALAGGIAAALIVPWTARNFVVFDRFLLLNSQAGQTFWNANHPDLGTVWDPSAMFPIPYDLQGANEVELSGELMRRGWSSVLSDPARFLRLSLDRLCTWLIFYPMARSSLFSNVARTASFGICLPFMLVGLLLSLREWRRWVLLYMFILAYSLIHVVSWVQIRYRMPVDVALMPFAGLAIATIVSWLRDKVRRPSEEVAT